MRLLPAGVWARVLKRRLPTSLWGRSLLIIVLPVLVMQVAVTWAFFDMHWQTVTARLSDGLAGDIAWASESYADDPTPQNLEVIAERAQRFARRAAAAGHDVVHAEFFDTVQIRVPVHRQDRIENRRR